MDPKSTTETTTTYEAPSVKDYGDLSKLTAGMRTGSFLDANFPTNTPLSNVTFS